MTSIIPGYEYDIFISYRQNDNKRGSWVTKFLTDEHNAAITLGVESEIGSNDEKKKAIL